MSPVVVRNPKNASSPFPAEPSLPTTDRRVLLDGRGFIFRPDPLIGPLPTRSERTELSEQVPDPAFQERREALIQELRSRPGALTGAQICEIAKREGLFERFKEEFDILHRLGVHPLGSEVGCVTKRKWHLLNNRAENSGQSIEDDFSNVQIQSLRTALMLSSFLNQLGLYDQHLRKQIVGSAILLKALKAGEILDRISVKNGVATIIIPDSEERLAQRCAKLDRDNVLDADVIGRLFDITAHTSGPGGFKRFLRMEADRPNITIVGEVLFRLIRAFDDITLTLPGRKGTDEPTLYVAGTPAEKMIVISNRRGDGILGQLLMPDPTSTEGVPQMVRFNSATHNPAKVSTMGQAQDLLSSTILCSLLPDAEGEDAATLVPNLVASLNQAIAGLAA